MKIVAFTLYRIFDQRKQDAEHPRMHLICCRVESIANWLFWNTTFDYKLNSVLCEMTDILIY